MGILSKLVMPAPVQAGWEVGKRVAGAIPWQAWAIAGVLVVGWYYGHTRYNAGVQSVQIRFDAYRADLMAKTRAAEDAAKRAQIAQAGAVKAAVDKQKLEDTHARAQLDETIRCLRDGSCTAVKLRQRFTCPRTQPATTIADGAGGGDDSGERGLRDADAEFLVRYAHDADRVVRKLAACQAVVTADRVKAP
jgi:hypothetical protein